MLIKYDRFETVTPCRLLLNLTGIFSVLKKNAWLDSLEFWLIENGRNLNFLVKSTKSSIKIIGLIQSSDLSIFNQTFFSVCEMWFLFEFIRFIRKKKIWLFSSGLNLRTMETVRYSEIFHTFAILRHGKPHNCGRENEFPRFNHKIFKHSRHWPFIRTM